MLTDDVVLNNRALNIIALSKMVFILKQNFATLEQNFAP